MSALDRRFEGLRKAVRSLLPSPVYKQLAEVYDAGACIRKIGLQEYRRLRQTFPDRHGPSHGEPVVFGIPGLLHPIAVRPGTSDPGEVIHTAIRETYGQYLPAPPIRFILDAGANIGDTTAWYLSRFPDATVVALEPEPNNFSVLRRNCEPYGSRAVLQQVGLWPRRARLRVVSAHVESGFSVVEVPEGETHDCLGVSPEDVMREMGVRTLDIFKCDIEGAERELFSSDCDGWLARTRCLTIEIHGEAAKRAVLGAVARHPFEHRVFRDLHVFRRLLPLAD